MKRIVKLFVKLAISITLVVILALLVLRWYNPPTTSSIEYRKGELKRGMGETTVLRYEWTPISSVPSSLQTAVIAAEHRRASLRGGFDADAVFERFEKGMNSERPREIRNIARHTARNLFLWQGRSFFLKLCETYFSFIINQLWTEKRIIEVYVNTVEFGPGVFGIGPASDVYFSKTPVELTLEESAFIAAVLFDPTRLHTENPSADVIAQREWIMERFPRTQQREREKR